LATEKYHPRRSGCIVNGITERINAKSTPVVLCHGIVTYCDMAMLKKRLHEYVKKQAIEQANLAPHSITGAATWRM